MYSGPCIVTPTSFGVMKWTHVRVQFHIIYIFYERCYLMQKDNSDMHTTSSNDGAQNVGTTVSSKAR